jgi:hypothetical protein
LTLLQFDFTSVLKSEKIGKKCKKKNAAAYAAERPLFLDSFLKLKIRSL